MTKLKLKAPAKVLIFLLVVGIAAVILWQTGTISNLLEKDNIVGTSNNPVANIPGNVNVIPSSDSMNLSLDEWIGWKPILDANGGLITTPDSLIGKAGLKVKISIINDASQSSTALIKGNLDAAGYTINRYAFLYPKFKENNVGTKMAYITNYSNGGDGIIAKNTINSVEDLVGKTIGVPRFSEAQTLVEWLISKSGLSVDQIKSIRSNIKYFNTPDDAAKAFFAGQLDAAATWQPYLSQAQETSGAKILFSTKAARNIILDGIVFRDDYLTANKEDISKFIECCLNAIPDYDTKFEAIKSSMPLFSTETNENIKGMTGDASLTDYASNNLLLGGVAQSLFVDMSNIWMSLGEKALPAEVNNAFSLIALQPLADKFTAVVVKKPEFSEKQREQAKAQDNKTALLTQKLTIVFETGLAAIDPESYPTLNKFADTAKILDGVIIQIEGNSDSVGNAANNKLLSEKRAKSVATYLQYQGIDPSRFVVIGNGPDKPIADNSTELGKAANRRTDAYFKIVN
jgi:outer membrane protein OmpA-like peptidoglycan-associated protein/ABC-type amino acid transport substrate-binding protein